MKTFSGAKMREQRKLKGLTQLQVAMATCSYPTSVNSWEQSKIKPSVDKLYALLKAFDCSIDDLFE